MRRRYGGTLVDISAAPRANDDADDEAEADDDDEVDDDDDDDEKEEGLESIENSGSETAP